MASGCNPGQRHPHLPGRVRGLGGVAVDPSLERERVDPGAAIADGKLLLRMKDRIKCFDLAGK